MARTRKWHFSAFVALVLITLVMGLRLVQRSVTVSESWSPPNILAISTCSLRLSDLAVYGSPRDWTPNVTKWAADGTFIFDNVFTEMSWSNLIDFVGNEGSAMLARYGYRGIRIDPGEAESKLDRFLEERTPLPYFYRLHFHKLVRKSSGDIDLAIVKAFAEFESKVRADDPRPFFTLIHHKFLHMPYGWGGDQVREKIFSDMKPVHAARLRNYFKNFLKYPNKVPLFAMTLPESLILQYLEHHPARNSPAFHAIISKTERRQYVGLTQNADLLRDWRKSEGYAEDVAMLRDFYGGRLAWYDQKIASMLNVFNDPELQKKTVVIYLGDHGESLMEHGQAAHGGVPYDELIHIPMIVRFPGAGGKLSQRITSQFSVHSLTPLIDGIMSGKIRAENLAQWAQRDAKSEFVFARDCGNGIHSVRWKNEWKMIHFLGQDTRVLYHLARDPKETRDVLEKYPDVAARLEEQLDSYSGEQANQHVCISALNE